MYACTRMRVARPLSHAHPDTAQPSAPLVETVPTRPITSADPRAMMMATIVPHRSAQLALEVGAPSIMLPDPCGVRPWYVTPGGPERWSVGVVDAGRWGRIREQ